MGILAKLQKDKSISSYLERVNDQDESQIEHFSTGSFALNGILSGDVYKGVPNNAITALVGPSNSSKSFILAHLVKEEKKKGYEVLLFDSERAVRKSYYEQIGCNTENLYRVPVGSVTSLKHKSYKLIREFYEKASDKDKLFVGVDSMGNLASIKELADVEKEKNVADQGSRAKDENSAFRIISSLAIEYDFPLVMTNHTYAAIGDLFAQREKISGGSKSIYNSHIILYFERLTNKEEVKDALGKTSKQPVGIRMKITTLKNREYPEEKTVYLNLRYDTGLNPYSGLLQHAIRAGIIQNKSRGYLDVASGKTIFDKNLYTPEVFTEEALLKINEWLGKNGYSSLSDIFSDDVASALGEISNGEEKTE